MDSVLTLDEGQLRDSTPAPPAPKPAQARDGRALIDATKPFAAESTAESWRHLFTVMALLAGGTAVAAMAPWWPVRLAMAVLDGLLIVRLFIVYHDHMHGALLKDSKLAKIILSIYGVLVMAPPRVWRETHNYHHAHTAQIVGSHIGSYPVVTVEMWKKMKPADRLKYRVVRHPITVLLGYVPIFMIGMCVNSLRKSVVRYWDSAAALLVNWTLTAGLIYFAGLTTAFFTFLLPLMVACASGAYLFYAQHNFPDMTLQPRHQWTYSKAALESSSYMELGPVMQWLTGNIGFHHVHHLNPLIPFYKLPDAMASIPELQHPGVTTLSPSAIAACFRLKLWDPQQGKMVGYP